MGIFLLNIIIVFVISFLLAYAILWSGLRIFKITPVTRKKMITYVFISAIATPILQYPYVRLVPYVENLAESIGSWAIVPLMNIPLLASSFVTEYLLLRYLLRLSGKQFWKLLAYIVIMGFAVTVILSALARVIRS